MTGLAYLRCLLTEHWFALLITLWFGVIFGAFTAAMGWAAAMKDDHQ